MPLVSIIMAVFNGEKYLRAAIDSILQQSYSKLEIVIIDDGSQDDTAKIAKSYKGNVHYYFQENQGQPAAVNYGLSFAKGAYIAFLDADDLYMVDKTACQVKFLQQNSEVDMVFGLVEQFHSPELSDQVRQKWICPTEIVPGYLAAAGMFRKECFRKVGLFNQEHRIGLFIDWYMRSSENGLKSALMSNLVLRRRIHEDNMGIKNSNQGYIEVVKAALKRRHHVSV